MYVVLCQPSEGEPDIYYGWESAEDAQAWIDALTPNDCPNDDHYWLEAIEVLK